MEPESRYRVPLSRLDPVHPPPAIGQVPTPDDEDAGSATAYVAEPLRRVYSPYTIEGMIQSAGEVAEGVARQGRGRWVIGTVVLSLVVGLLSGFARNLWALIHG